MERLVDSGVWREKLRNLRFHDLRHTYASIAIANGEHLVVVSRTMGHSTPTVTGAIYAHLFEGHGEAVAARLDKTFEEAIPEEAPKATVTPLPTH